MQAQILTLPPGTPAAANPSLTPLLLFAASNSSLASAGEAAAASCTIRLRVSWD